MDKILEIGCGTGVFTQVFTTLCRRVSAVDLSPKMAAEARKRNPNVEIHVGSAEHIPFKSQRFDAVVCISAFCYIINQQRALMEIRRVLKPNGKLLLIEPNILCPAYWIMYFTRHRRLKLFLRRLFRSTPTTLRRTLEDNGFQVQECRAGNFVPHGVGKLRSWFFFIPLDWTIGKLPLFRALGMRVFCAAIVAKGKLR